MLVAPVSINGNSSYGFYNHAGIADAGYAAVSPLAVNRAEIGNRLAGQESDLTEKINGEGECQSCKNRKYVDGSDDPGVSFKTPTKIDSGRAASAVLSHEYEHVAHEKARAERENKRIVSQSVTLHTAICSECGKAYVSGGVTRTVMKDKPQDISAQNGLGRNFDGFA